MQPNKPSLQGITWDDEQSPQGITRDDEQPQPDSVASRYVTGLADPLYGLAQIADKAINPIRQLIAPGSMSMDDVVRQREAAYKPPEGVDWGRMAGNVINPANLVPGVAMSTPVRAAATMGAVQSALQPTDPDRNFAVEKAKQAGIGAAGGALLAKTLAGLKPTDEARRLMDEGIQPTVGQSLGGVANTAEQKLTSVPFVGDAITYARNRAQNEFEGRLLKRALGQQPKVDRFGIVERASKGAPQTLDEANAVASKLYDDVVPQLSVPDLWAGASARKAAGDAMQRPEMTDQNRRILEGVVSELFDGDRLRNLTPEELKNLDSQMGFLVRKYGKGDPASQTLSDAFRDVHRAFREELNTWLTVTKNNPGALNEVNKVYARLFPLNKASSLRTDERMTPRNVEKSLARQAGVDPSRLNDPLVNAAVRVLPSMIPDSGTAGRMALAGGTLVGGGTLGVLPETAVAGTVAALGASRPVQRAIMGNTALQQGLLPMSPTLAQMIASALRSKGEPQ